ncbi:nitrous oxide reductase [Malaciobacter halophilus]|uniref:Nitrous oxide reductase n=1 Tax=Malaciobacter halophilus TaxID=197482 RepID=A0A2N1J5X4_9BACT|nr:nitrous oxide reductase accessory protein NosL [Malaciobacter halophilus]AXH09227.1 NosL domain-containing protein [Malaciobacter halophilus]PKI81862.1 nitrous oxide reductase [Malaciobacter halophilus]
MLKRLLPLVFLLISINLFASSNKMFQTVNKNQATLVKTDSSKQFCNVCGMHLVKFYKTSHAVEFKNGHKEQYCSLHCFAKVNEKFNNLIKNVKVVNTKTLELIDAKKAFYVVGSSVKGTMSMTSKYAFLTKKDALEFQKEYGGDIKTFDEALKIATNDLKNDNIRIDKKRAKMAKKGKKIYNAMCNKDIQTPDFNSIGEAKKYLIDNNICKNLKPKMLQAVAIYKYDPSLATNENKRVHVPKDAKCPVCGMYVAKYPKWAAKIEVDKTHTHYFDGTKDMFKFYFNPKKFSHNHTKQQMKNITVTDYYTLEAIDGKSAFYVVGSNVYGPMGEELIPFKDEKSANAFKNSHYGKKILKFEEVKESMLY